jgi:hypothetical protein
MYFVAQAQVSAKPLWWHNTLALMKMDLIHKLGHSNVVLDVLSIREEFQAMNTIQRFREKHKC